METDANPQPDPISIRSEIRADLIKRLFAVAISVGFATTLASMGCVKNGTTPTYSEWEQLAALLTALLATVASWDGYLVSIQSKPLRGTARFWTDIVLVFIYMFLLISASHPTTWLPTLCVIFALYILWDIFSINEYSQMYWYEENPSDSTWNVAGVYFNGLKGSRLVSHGPIITLYWFVYFCLLLVMSPTPPRNYSIFITCASAATALMFYRYDKIKRDPEKNTRKIVVIIALLIFTFCAYQFL